MPLELVIEAGSTVCESAKFTLLRSSYNAAEHQQQEILSDAAAAADDDDETIILGKIKLIIGQGNVFHPYSCFQIRPPVTNHQKQITLHIGSNNLFEEKSNVILDLSQITTSSEEQQFSDSSDGLRFSAIGSYNNFTPTCRVECRCIGNANIFGPKSNVVVKNVENGNLFQAGSYIREDATSNVRYQEKVFYVLTGDSNRLAMNKCRKHADGVRKNIVEVSTLLRASRTILRHNHRVMAVTDIDDEDQV
jgi:hypothetical protein